MVDCCLLKIIVFIPTNEFDWSLSMCAASNCIQIVWQAKNERQKNWKNKCILICVRHIQSNWKYYVIVNHWKNRLPSTKKSKCRTQTNLYLHGIGTQMRDTNEIPFRVHNTLRIKERKKISTRTKKTNKMSIDQYKIKQNQKMDFLAQELKVPTIRMTEKKKITRLTKWFYFFFFGCLLLKMVCLFSDNNRYI